MTEQQPEKGISRAKFLQLSGAGLGGAALLASPARAVAQSSESYIDFNEHGAGHFSNGFKEGAAVKNGALRLSDPMERGNFYVGVLTSRPVGTSISYDTLVPSWEARTPPGTRVLMQVRVRYGGRWSNWMSMGPWSAVGTSRSVSPTHSDWNVLVDTIVSRHGERADAYQYQLRLLSNRRDCTPAVRKVGLVASQSSKHGEVIDVGNLKRAWGKDLPVPRRSQYDYDGGGEVWCSPTSLNMVMGYWANRTNRSALSQPVPRTARGVRDYNYGWGNWPFNTGYSSHFFLESSVSRFNSIQQVERWIDAGIPLIVSIAWDNRYSGQRLDNAAITWSDGHLLVIRGFTGDGNGVIVNDPAGSPRSEVRRVYRRDQFYQAWFRYPGSSGGVVYLVHPRGWDTPYPYASNGSW